MAKSDRDGRCQWVTPIGQCKKDAIADGLFCEQHSPKGKGVMERYLITTRTLGDAPHRHIAANEIKSLREEIALTRAMIEKRLNMVDNDAEFVAAMPVIQSGMLTVEKLVSSCHAMETKLGLLLNKSALISLAQEIIQIIDDSLKGVPGRNEIVEKVGEEIVTAIAKQEN
jgi:hypothetical protein